MNAKKFSGPTKCGHCENLAPMEIRGVLPQMRSDEGWGYGWTHELLVCPACDGVILRRYYWHDDLDPADVEMEVVYPREPELPLGLPATIRQEFQAALKVRSTSPNAYGVLLGRLLELVCDDRGASRGNLSARLKDLSAREEIPKKLVEVAEKMQELRHIGAHAWAGELSPAEVRILDSLSRAILEYVYSAPLLVKQAADRLQKVRMGRRRTAKKPAARQKRKGPEPKE